METAENKAIGVGHNDVVVAGHVEAAKHESHAHPLQAFIYFGVYEGHTGPMHLSNSGL